MKVETHNEFSTEKFAAQTVQVAGSERPKDPTLKKLLFSLVEPIPRPLGTVARKFLYPILSKNWGKGSYVQAWVEVLGVNNIIAGDNIRILRYSILNCDFENSLLKLGKDVSLDRNVSIRLGENCTVEIGEGTYIGPFTCVSGPGNITIGRHCMIASMAGIYAKQHHHVGSRTEGITIEDKCWIGTGAKILDGVTIGYGSAIGAGAVVTKTIPPYSVAVGVPARVLENRRTTPDE
ncbi:acyltransferase [Nodosilinea sp. PGN35]|uniref:acyltransferase n=1 Tax=Nodosilinea sp. PGN35 TaxID=3020489 RepID=UPI0023B28831|nr:acyltransferase [Nodosilinea sp. TSF1-S3]MDF0367079.1 acyltransferase [Nodosilinea sp. TSF1-S3]